MHFPNEWVENATAATIKVFLILRQPLMKESFLLGYAPRTLQSVFKIFFQLQQLVE